MEPAFHSIPHAIWFMLVTMTTVGYGDVSPNTEMGRMITVLAMVFGVLFLSMPLAIVGNNFCNIWLVGGGVRAPRPRSRGNGGL